MRFSSLKRKEKPLFDDDDGPGLFCLLLKQSFIHLQFALFLFLPLSYDISQVDEVYLPFSTYEEPETCATHPCTRSIVVEHFMYYPKRKVIFFQFSTRLIHTHTHMHARILHVVTFLKEHLLLLWEEFTPLTTTCFLVLWFLSAAV